MDTHSCIHFLCVLLFMVNHWQWNKWLTAQLALQQAHMVVVLITHGTHTISIGHTMLHLCHALCITVWVHHILNDALMQLRSCHLFSDVQSINTSFSYNFHCWNDKHGPHWQKYTDEWRTECFPAFSKHRSDEFQQTTICLWDPFFDDQNTTSSSCYGSIKMVSSSCCDSYCVIVIWAAFSFQYSFCKPPPLNKAISRKLVSHCQYQVLHVH